MDVKIWKGMFLVFAVITALVIMGVSIWDAGYQDGYLTGSINGIFYKDIVGESPDTDWEIEHMHDSIDDYAEAVIQEPVRNMDEDSKYICDGLPENEWEIQAAIDALFDSPGDVYIINGGKLIKVD